MRNKLLDNRPTDPQELLLIRIGHHLWRQRKEWPNEAGFRALQAVWDRKEALRVILRKQWLEMLENRIRRLAATGYQKRANSSAGTK